MKYFCIILLFLSNFKLTGQCVPPFSDKCLDAPFLCSLEEIGGFHCRMKDQSNPSACLPCNGTGVASNSSWWSFVSEGGKVKIEIYTSNCVNGHGIQAGINGNCSCTENIVCNSTCVPSYILLEATLLPCKQYFLWIDGCNGNVCDVSIQVQGGYAPKLQSFNLSLLSQDTICRGCCADFEVSKQSNGCKPNYIWTIDGKFQLIDTIGSVKLCFPEVGTFSVCVEGIIGDPSRGSICDTKTKCTNVVVKNSTKIIDLDEVNLVNLKPNPSNGDFSINWNGINDEVVKVVVYNSIGAVYKVMQVSRGSTNLNVEANDFYQGVYFIELQFSVNRKFVKKFVKI